jgi:predicted enzyme related to lactoylglutathione lyase
MAIDFYVGIPVKQYAAALVWYELFLGAPPTMIASDSEAVWDVADHRSLYISHSPEHAGHVMFSLFVDDLDERVSRIAERGLEPAVREVYPDGVRKMIYRDPDGNEIGLGQIPPAV